MENCPKLLDFMSKKKWQVKREEQPLDEKSLQLTLSPPGENNNNNSNNSMFGENSFGYYSEMTKMPILTKWSSTKTTSLFVEKESSEPCSTKVVELQNAEKKTFSAINTAGAQKRTAPAPVVGWPPIRSFRKNLATTSSCKLSSELQNESPNKKPAEAGENKPAENSQKGLFVKINMDGIPIGRKVDLKAYDSYEKLSSAVDQLFRGLLAAQSDSCANGDEKQNEGKTIICGLLDGSGEYTLVYEDNEGDRMLVGDVPWHMFVSTMKRLRVLKTSDLPMLRRGAKQGKITIESWREELHRGM